VAALCGNIFFKKYVVLEFAAELFALLFCDDVTCLRTCSSGHFCLYNAWFGATFYQLCMFSVSCSIMHANECKIKCCLN
jgi:hypothetical protein